MRQRVLEQRFRRGCQAFAECEHLIPKGLRCDDHAMANKDALLPSKRNVIEILVERHLDREGERVAPALDCTLGTERCFHAASAAANVFLLLDVYEALADLDEVDHLG